MLRAGLAALALVAAATAAPITEPTKTLQARQLTIGDPSSPSPTFIILPPVVGGLNPSTKRATSTLAARQFTWGDPSTWFGSGDEQPPTPSPTFIILPPVVGGLNPSTKRATSTLEARQLTIGVPSTGPIVPDQPIPGGSIVPDPEVPSGPVQISD
ncbi:Uu.00g043170.m01.CDS01 [Anthostomella pinea]|uniref:Uu.00g043170.m01.CDS01 n=1 Tax=Anthostomella pinea TaxID=933095 RepID=A0AAI8YBT0_9PEZI|nr:Uu.00g043170.m01.CDS01 [Anthostomella pinea]